MHYLIVTQETSRPYGLSSVFYVMDFVFSEQIEDFVFYVILLRINILLLRGGGVPILAEFIGLQITDVNQSKCWD